MIEKIYIDLDGVLADFEEGVYRRTLQVNLIDHNSWRKEVFNDPEFFKQLEPFWYAEELIDYCQSIAPVEILTATGDTNPELSIVGKRVWCQEHIPEGIPINIVQDSKSKAAYATTNSVLIDDNKIKCLLPWIGAGGLSIHHVTASVTIHRLNELVKMYK